MTKRDIETGPVQQEEAAQEAGWFSSMTTNQKLVFSGVALVSGIIVVGLGVGYLGEVSDLARTLAISFGSLSTVGGLGAGGVMCVRKLGEVEAETRRNNPLAGASNEQLRKMARGGRENRVMREYRNEVVIAGDNPEAQRRVDNKYQNQLEQEAERRRAQEERKKVDEQIHNPDIHYAVPYLPKTVALGDAKQTHTPSRGNRYKVGLEESRDDNELHAKNAPEKVARPKSAQGYGRRDDDKAQQKPSRISPVPPTATNMQQTGQRVTSTGQVIRSYAINNSATREEKDDLDLQRMQVSQHKPRAMSAGPRREEKDESHANKHKSRPKSAGHYKRDQNQKPEDKGRF